MISYISTLQDILGHSDSFRRTWDTAKYEKLAKDRLKKEKDGSKSLSTGYVHMHSGFLISKKKLNIKGIANFCIKIDHTP